MAKFQSKTTSSMESNTRKIDIRGILIVYTLKCDGVQDYFTYNETLLSILKLDRLKPFRDDGRLRIKIRHNGSDVGMYMYDVAIACYLGKINVNTFLDDMQKFIEYKSRLDLTVDHADGHIRNNTKYNLSLMGRTPNLAKSDITARFTIPTLVVTAYVNERYRIYYEQREVVFDRVIADINVKLDNAGMPLIAGSPVMSISRKCICSTPEDFVEHLKQIANGGIYYRGLEMVSPLKTSRGWKQPKGGCFLDDILHSIRFQEIIAGMNEDEFDIYTSSTTSLGA